MLAVFCSKSWEMLQPSGLRILRPLGSKASRKTPIGSFVRGSRMTFPAETWLVTLCPSSRNVNGVALDPVQIDADRLHNSELR